MPAKKEKTEQASKAKTDKHRNIHELAFEYYQERIKNNKPGDAISDWIAAEKKINKKK